MWKSGIRTAGKDIKAPRECFMSFRHLWPRSLPDDTKLIDAVRATFWNMVRDVEAAFHLRIDGSPEEGFVNSNIRREIVDGLWFCEIDPIRFFHG
jgi:hypothetical protein